ncbi:hypothetical protein FQ082_09290 [Psychrobacter sp. ANT_H56B]|uniref:hypothetical protein n=1 Tax=Psychrobacter sp. ANT_H56B TaxID=2597353 RepID=UPI0011F13DEB|nr:hypothetical protein [Psychrobacter sp. ANT_H56B]KAA0924782.1 hypothetical protein FQ082_09290 [Psychrobacter sp. ANT_H56B]
MLVLEKEFLSLEEVSLYFNENGFNFDLIVESDYWQVSEIVSDLVKENRLRVVIYYDGQGRLNPLEKLSHDNNQGNEVKTANIQGYFQSKSLIKSFGNSAGISKDFSYEAFKIFELPSIYKFDPTAFTYFLLDNEKVHSRDLRFVKADLDIFFNNQPHKVEKELQARLELARNSFRKQQDEITSLKTQLNNALDIIEKNNKVDCSLENFTVTDKELQSYDWQKMNPYTYPPELHLAMMIWEKSYILNEIENRHITDHSQRFDIIAEKIGLDKDVHGGALISRLSKITNPQINKQKGDIEKLKVIKDLNIKDLGDGNPQG